jgi:hypothetical protein
MGARPPTGLEYPDSGIRNGGYGGMLAVRVHPKDRRSTMTMAGTGGTPMAGARVMTADGDELGKVKEVSGGCFKVDAASSSADEVRLSIDKDRVGDAKVDGPGHTGIHRHE